MSSAFLTDDAIRAFVVAHGFTIAYVPLSDPPEFRLERGAVSFQGERNRIGDFITGYIFGTMAAHHG